MTCLYVSMNEFDIFFIFFINQFSFSIIVFAFAKSRFLFILFVDFNFHAQKFSKISFAFVCISIELNRCESRRELVIATEEECDCED